VATALSSLPFRLSSAGWVLAGLSVGYGDAPVAWAAVVENELSLCDVFSAGDDRPGWWEVGSMRNRILKGEGERKAAEAGS
jgi:hypothetical protein